MSAYLSVMVHNAYGPAATTVSLNLKDMFDTKYFVYLYVDGGEGIKLRAARQPHQIAIEPGAHTIVFSRKPLGKMDIQGMINSGFGAVLGGVLGGGAGAAAGAHMAGKFGKDDPLGNARVLEFREGQTIACEIKAAMSGSPKITWR